MIPNARIASNKTTVSVKAALTEALEKHGGVPALVSWGQKEPREFYKLWGRMAARDEWA